MRRTTTATTTVLVAAALIVGRRVDAQPAGASPKATMMKATPMNMTTTITITKPMTLTIARPMTITIAKPVTITATPAVAVRPPSPVTSASASGPAAGAIVPLYTRPDHPSWSAMVAAKQAHPSVHVVAVVNPSDGPGDAQSPTYAAGVERLLAAGIDVIGYVATGYAGRSLGYVQADIDRWCAFYPQIGGIFFDEQSHSAGDESYYRTLSQYAKGKGLAFTVGNPGTDVAESFIGALDTMLIYENRGVSSTQALTGWHTKYPAQNFGVIPYGTALDLAYVRAARQHVGYIYLNNDEPPNPWDSLPPYFADLLAALE
jgi:Spherulation-specific family 4